MRGKTLSLFVMLCAMASFAFAAPAAGPVVSRVIADYEMSMLTIEGSNLDDHTELALGAAGGAIVPLTILGVDPHSIVAALPDVAPGTYSLMVTTGRGNNQGQKFTLLIDLTLGAVGPRGPQGEQGPEGEKGDKGDQGDQGEQGPQGIQGPKGDRGDQGIQGIQGPKGDQGIQGPKGDRGDIGPRGLQGERGPQGATGATGPAGPTGPQGPQGPAGTPAGSWNSDRVSCPGNNICTSVRYCSTKVLAGGCGHHDWNGAVADIEVAYSGPDGSNSWRCSVDNTDGDARAYEIWWICAQ